MILWGMAPQMTKVGKMVQNIFSFRMLLIRDCVFKFCRNKLPWSLDQTHLLWLQTEETKLVLLHDSCDTYWWLILLITEFSIFSLASVVSSSHVCMLCFLNIIWIVVGYALWWIRYIPWILLISKIWNIEIACAFGKFSRIFLMFNSFWGCVLSERCIS